MSTLNAISPIDGRYASKTKTLQACFSELALIQHRFKVEVEYFIALLQELGLLEDPLSGSTLSAVQSFSIQTEAEAEIVKQLEAKTNHDVKAVEYALKQRLESHPELARYIEYVHFGLTSEDVNNLAYALMIRQARDDIFLPLLEKLFTTLQTFAHRYADLPMLARTHGQSATPTTLGKEIAIFAYRLSRQIELLKAVPILGKLGGATGGLNAHAAAYPSHDWLLFSQKFVTHLGLTHNPLTTQIESHDGIAELSHAFIRINTILINLARDIWSYIGLGYLKQKIKEAEVGSSAMPHKVNPIDFENAEGNLGIANALWTHFAEKLPISRFQRDLSDSTVLRNLGVAFAHSLIAYQSLLTGFEKVTPSEKALVEDLHNHAEVLAEAIQTLLRKMGLEAPYEQLKTLTRGRAITLNTLHEFIDTLPIEEAQKNELKALRPETYIGLAAKLARQI